MLPRRMLLRKILPTEAAFENLRSAGIAPVVAAGNSYKHLWPLRPRMPALRDFSPVGAVSTKDQGYCKGLPEYGTTARDKVACFSNFLAIPTLPFWLREPLSGRPFPVTGSRTKSGTSMAAPHVAGAWAVLKNKKPNAPLTDILDALKATGVMVSDYRSGQETPRIDVKGAVDFLDTNAIKLSFTKIGTGQGMVNFSPAGNRSVAGEAASSPTLQERG